MGRVLQLYAERHTRKTIVVKIAFEDSWMQMELQDNESFNTCSCNATNVRSKFCWTQGLFATRRQALQTEKCTAKCQDSLFLFNPVALATHD